MIIQPPLFYAHSRLEKEVKKYRTKFTEYVKYVIRHSNLIFSLNYAIITRVEQNAAKIGTANQKIIGTKRNK